MKELVLRNGISIPQIGLGTWQITDREKVKEIVGAAYDEGYRLIDTAAAYTNEMAIGKAIQSLELSREELILSDKVWNTCRGYDAVRDACYKSMKKLKITYLDLYLIHWPASPKLYPNWKEINADT
ncbi:MAG: aldo/keto reductase, partial [Agathobacter sp.]|nr:aldo/keto reductase [Agathobacter sp.]